MHTIKIYKQGEHFLTLESPHQYVATNNAAEILCINRVMITDSLGEGSISLLDKAPGFLFTYEATA